MVVETRSKTKNASIRTYTSSALATIYLVKWLIAFGVGILHTLLVNLFYKNVPEPYMDEIFHVNQTEAYCKGNWDYWNSKLTTPPLIYAIAALTGFCGRERYLNSALIPLTFVGLTRLRLAWSNGHNNFKDAILCSLAVLFLPVLFETNILFYTDLLSLTLVVFALGTPAPTLSALIFTLAVFSRQTNIIWAGFYCLKSLEKDFNPKKPFTTTLVCVFQHWAFALLGLGFIIFFVRNGFSIVLGDKTAHELHFHLPQLFYFFFFIMASSWPIALYNFGLIVKHIYRNFITYALMGLLMIPAIHFLSYNHLYLISDNRHFTFYIWRKWFLRGQWFKFFSIPFYLFSIAFISMAVRHVRFVSMLGWFFSICFVLIPAHLVEFRYFIIPFALWRLHVHKSTTNSVTILEILSHLAVNFLTILIFLYRPFKWPNEPENLQRFMW